MASAARERTVIRFPAGRVFPAIRHCGHTQGERGGVDAAATGVVISPNGGAGEARQAAFLRRHIAAIPYTDRPVAHAAQSMTLRRDAPWGVRVPDPGTHCATSIRTTSRRGAIHGARPRVSAPLSVASQGAYPPRSVITSAGERGGADAAATGGVLGPPFAFASNEWWMRAQHFT